MWKTQRLLEEYKTLLQATFLMMLNLYSFIQPCPETTKAEIFLILKQKI